MWKKSFGTFMGIWAVISHGWLLLQAYKIFSEKDASGISAIGFSVVLLGAIFWFIYAAFVMEKQDFRMMTSSGVGFSLGIVVLIGVLKYNKKPLPKTAALRCE